jgi:hypothetical protein
MRGHEVVRIFRELALGQRGNEMMDAAWCQEEQQEPTDQLSGPIEALADDADLEDAIQPVLRFKHVLVSSEAILPSRLPG